MTATCTEQCTHRLDLEDVLGHIDRFAATIELALEGNGPDAGERRQEAVHTAVSLVAQAMRDTVKRARAGEAI